MASLSTTINDVIDNSWIGQSEPLKIFVVFLVTGIIAYWLSKLLAKIVVLIAQKVALQSDATSSDERFIQLRRAETYLSVFIALMRFAVVAGAIILAWSIISDNNSSSANAATAIGASTVFVVLAGATIGSLLRDVTAGATMIIERWFSVGDYIRVEPFGHVQGVVERATLRSTKLRDISGEVIWMHNQHMQAVSVTPHGVRTEVIDVFVDNVEVATRAIDALMKTLHTGPTMLAAPMRIRKTEQIAGTLWRISIEGKTVPGREWLIEDFFVNALKDADRSNDDFHIVYGPLVRYLDETAEKRFRRAVRIKQ